MNIIIRCDAGGSHGLGHAIRMKALADVLTARGAAVSFTSESRSVLGDLVAPYACGDADVVTHGNLECLIVDTKAPIAESWYRALGCRAVVRIDHPHATAGSCDVLVMPNMHLQESQAQQLRETFQDRLLYGWNYVMLSPAVTTQPPLPVRHASRFGIVFCTGGSDHTGILETMMQWTLHLDITPPLVFERPGSQRQYLRALRHASLVVGMFGVTCYECLWYKTPMLVFGRTPEDVAGAAILQQAVGNVLWNAGQFSACDAASFCTLVRESYGAARQRVIAPPEALVPSGLTRVADAILALGG